MCSINLKSTYTSSRDTEIAYQTFLGVDNKCSLHVICISVSGCYWKPCLIDSMTQSLLGLVQLELAFWHCMVLYGSSKAGPLIHASRLLLQTVRGMSHTAANPGGSLA